MDIAGRQRTVRRRIHQMQRVDCRNAGVETLASSVLRNLTLTRRPDQHLGRNTELLVRAPDNGDGEPSLATQNFGDACARPPRPRAYRAGS